MLLAGLAVGVAALQGLRLLPAQGAGGPPSPGRTTAGLVGAVLVLSTPLVVARAARRGGWVRAGLLSLLAGGSAALAAAVLTGDLVVAAVLGLGLATALALAPRGRPALVVRGAAAVALAASSAALGAAGLPDPLVLLVVPAVVLADALAARRAEEPSLPRTD